MTGGVFFSFDGIDGAGKSTQVELFREWLGTLGHTVVTCRDPGSTRLGEAVRRILLDRHDLAIGRRSEMLLYMSARAQMVDEIIRPALDRGDVVVSDRFLLSNVAYQAYAGGLDLDATWQVGRVATCGIQPHLTFVLDLDTDIAWRRLQREHDRMESQGKEFLCRVRAGYLTEAKLQSTEIVVIDASREPGEIQTDIRKAAERVLTQKDGRAAL